MPTLEWANTAREVTLSIREAREYGSAFEAPDAMTHQSIKQTNILFLYFRMLER
jgi:hypothetical protein